MNPRLPLALRILPPSAVIAVAGAWAWHQHRIASELNREINRLRPLAQEAAILSEKAGTHPTPPPDTNELIRLQADHLELLRLRREITGMRQHASLSPEALQQRIEESKARTEAALKEANLIVERRRAKDLINQTQGSLGQAIFFLNEALKRTTGPIPTSWNDVRRILEAPTSPDPTDSLFTPQQVAENLRALIRALDDANREPLKPSDFEFLPVPASYHHSPTAAPPHLLIFRERTPRRVPDSGWHRAYGYLDGSTDEAISPDGNFAPWEADAMKSATPNSIGSGR